MIKSLYSFYQNKCSHTCGFLGYFSHAAGKGQTLFHFPKTTQYPKPNQTNLTQPNPSGVHPHPLLSLTGGPFGCLAC